MEALEIAPLIGKVVISCYNLHQNYLLRKVNRTKAKLLAEHLREISISLETTTVSTVHLTERGIYKDLCSDFTHISDEINHLVEDIKRRFALSHLLNPQDIANKLDHCTALTLSWKGRLENVQISLARREREDTYLNEWNKLILSFGQVVQGNAAFGSHPVVKDAFHAFDDVAKSLLPAEENPSTSPISSQSQSFEDSEIQSHEALQNVPSAVRELVLAAARKGIPEGELAKLVSAMMRLWDGWHIPEDDITFETKHNKKPVRIGTGAFGVVFAGTLQGKSNGGSSPSSLIPVAIKIIDLSRNNKLTVEVMREVLLQMTMKHHCILPCYGVNLPAFAGSTKDMSPALQVPTIEEDLEAQIVTERMTCSVADALGDGRLSLLRSRVKVATDVATALSFLHSRRIVHRDVNPRNVLINLDSGGDLVGYAKLANFGSSRRGFNEHSLSLLTSSTKLAGTPLFMPPEALRDLNHCRSTKSWDVWSYGILLCVLFATDGQPDTTPADAQVFAREGTWHNEMQAWANKIYLEDVRDIALGCLEDNPNKRVEITEIEEYFGAMQGQVESTSSLSGEEMSPVP